MGADDFAILLIEDDALIALDTEMILNEAGWTSVTMATTVRQALTLLESSRFDFVLLDANLKNETSAPVAAQLFKLGTKFLVITGYSRGQLPKEFEGATVFAKPIEPKSLVRQVRAMT
jgi:DNA-binding response OmpR family regulator